MRIKNPRFRKNLKSNIGAWMLLFPALLFMLIFTVYPVFRSLYLSLCKFKMGMTAPEFAGLQNYISLSQNKIFWKVIGNTIEFSLITVLPSMIIGIGLALLVNRKGKKVGFMRTAYFYPVVMPMIAVASVWMFVYMAKNGLLDQTLIRLGLKPMNVLSNKDTVLPAMAVMYVWKEAGYLMVFFLSGMQNISEEIYEAARIDGARFWTTFRKITFPLLGPTILFVSTIAFTNSFKLVDHVVIMTEGAPNNASMLLLYYLYQQGFTNFNYGISSALTVIMLVALLVVSLPRFLNQDKKVHYN
jgi:sn-glycerol 3-phosphate transport system permease protein